MPISPRRPLSTREAVVLGALQGPAELLPISSSGHIALVPELLGWQYGRLDADLRKAFEVALHAGTALALLIVLRDEVRHVARSLDSRRLSGIALALLPPALAAAAFERPIEQRLGSARAVARAQIVGGLALAAADRRPAVRAEAQAGALDHIAIGLGQAAALAPGVSRNGGTLTALRTLRFERRAANRLSRHAALPIIVAATVLKSARLARSGLAPELRLAFGAGAATAFGSTLLCFRLVGRMDAAGSYAPFAIYRVGLGALGLIYRPRLSSEQRPPRSAGAGA